jgi:hypothetical protein
LPEEGSRDQAKDDEGAECDFERLGFGFFGHGVWEYGEGCFPTPLRRTGAEDSGCGKGLPSPPRL